MSIKQAIEALLAERNELNEVLARIGDMAHHASTGPAVPDKLWEIRGLAYDHVILETDEPAALAALRSMPAEPVGRFTEDGTLTGGVEWIPYSGPQLKTGDLLYATPPPAPVLLTDAEILEIMREWPVETNVWADHIDFARAVEQSVIARVGRGEL